MSTHNVGFYGEKAIICKISPKAFFNLASAIDCGNKNYRESDWLLRKRLVTGSVNLLQVRTTVMGLIMASLTEVDP